MSLLFKFLYPYFLFFEYCFDLTSLFTLLWYYPFSFSFISLCLIWLLVVYSITYILMCELLSLERMKVTSLSSENMFTVIMKQFSYLSFFLNSLRSSMENVWFILRYVFSRWYPHSIFLRVIDNGIRTMIKGIRERVSPWKIPLLMFTSPNTSVFAMRKVFHCSMSLNSSIFLYYLLIALAPLLPSPLSGASYRLSCNKPSLLWVFYMLYDFSKWL